MQKERKEKQIEYIIFYILDWLIIMNNDKNCM